MCLDRCKAYFYHKCLSLQVLKAAELVKQEMGPVKMVINCCNMPSPRSLVAQPPYDVQSTIDLSVLSHFWVSRLPPPSIHCL